MDRVDRYRYAYYIQCYSRDAWRCIYKGFDETEFIRNINMLKIAEFEKVTSYQNGKVFASGTWDIEMDTFEKRLAQLERRKAARDTSHKDALKHIDTVFPAVLGPGIEREAEAWIKRATDHEAFAQGFENEFKRHNKEMERKEQELQKAVGHVEHKTVQITSSSHVCWQDQKTWWARISLLDENSTPIQNLESAHNSKKEANAWAEAIEKMLLFTWILM